MMKSKAKPLPKDLEDWLVVSAADSTSPTSIGSKAMLEKFGKSDGSAALAPVRNAANQAEKAKIAN
jgi:hypothetical protein